MNSFLKISFVLMLISHLWVSVGVYVHDMIDQEIEMIELLSSNDTESEEEDKKEKENTSDELYKTTVSFDESHVNLNIDDDIPNHLDIVDIQTPPPKF